MATISLDEKSSEIFCNYDEPIELDKSKNYEICLLNFTTYNSIPNVSEKLLNNTFTFFDENNKKTNIIIPTGSYEIDEISKIILKESKLRDSGTYIRANLNTLKVELRSPFQIDFTEANSIRTLLGFSSQIIKPNTFAESDLPVDIMRINVIRIKCNLATGSYINNIKNNVIHEFSIVNGPGEKIDENPNNLIYFPIITNSIRNIYIRIVDQYDNLIDFRGERISIRLHIKQSN